MRVVLFKLFCGTNRNQNENTVGSAILKSYYLPKIQRKSLIKRQCIWQQKQAHINFTFNIIFAVWNLWMRSFILYVGQYCKIVVVY